MISPLKNRLGGGKVNQPVQAPDNYMQSRSTGNSVSVLAGQTQRNFARTSALKGEKVSRNEN